MVRWRADLADPGRDRDTGRAVVVEGYLDALMCLQEGVPNVVATLGTALTDRHVRLLGRLCRDVVLVFDADSFEEMDAHLRSADPSFGFIRRPEE